MGFFILKVKTKFETQRAGLPVIVFLSELVF